MRIKDNDTLLTQLQSLAFPPPGVEVDLLGVDLDASIESLLKEAVLKVRREYAANLKGANDDDTVADVTSNALVAGATFYNQLWDEAEKQAAERQAAERQAAASALSANPMGDTLPAVDTSNDLFIAMAMRIRLATTDIESRQYLTPLEREILDEELTIEDDRGRPFEKLEISVRDKQIRKDLEEAISNSGKDLEEYRAEVYAHKEAASLAVIAKRSKVDFPVQSEPRSILWRLKKLATTLAIAMTGVGLLYLAMYKLPKADVTEGKWAGRIKSLVLKAATSIGMLMALSPALALLVPLTANLSIIGGMVSSTASMASSLAGFGAILAKATIGIPLLGALGPVGWGIIGALAIIAAAVVIAYVVKAVGKRSFADDRNEMDPDFKQALVSADKFNPAAVEKAIEVTLAEIRDLTGRDYSEVRMGKLVARLDDLRGLHTEKPQGFIGKIMPAKAAPMDQKLAAMEAALQDYCREHEFKGENRVSHKIEIKYFYTGKKLVEMDLASQGLSKRSGVKPAPGVSSSNASSGVKKVAKTLRPEAQIELARISGKSISSGSVPIPAPGGSTAGAA